MDDDPHLRALVCTTLADPTYRILEAADGISALTLARQEHPDLVILDWLMPGLSGLDIATALRQDPTTALLPIIMLTACGEASDSAHAQARGATAYLVKPFSPLALVDAVHTSLARRSRPEE